MEKTSVSRRGFLRIGAASAALAGSGALSFKAWQRGRAFADEGELDARRVPTTCNGCSNKCGLWVNTVDGKIKTIEGIKDHPNSRGMVCARGHGFGQFVYSKERLTQPLKKNGMGEFEPISWDDAYAEIGAKVKDILSAYGPEAVALIRDPRPNINFYGPRFMNALGSANVYTHGAACNTSQVAGFRDVLGSDYSADVANAKMIMFIGRSYADGIRPSATKSLADLAESGKAHIVVVDPRYNNSAPFADQWVPIIPGMDLALVLGMCNVLVTEELYDKDFVEQHAEGFEEFAAEVGKFTPAWAAEKCGIRPEVVEQLARDMAAAAPAAVIEQGWHAAFGCAHRNSYETARAIAAFNALLGNFGQKGGALIMGAPKLGDLDEAKFPKVPKPAAKRVGDADYPLTVAGMGTALAVVQAAMQDKMKAVFFYNSNAAKGYANPKAWKEALAKTDLVVSIEVQLSETALLADYVLPECSPFERMEVPELLGGKAWSVALRAPAIEKLHPGTRPGDQIFCELAEACGVGRYFKFTIEELVRAQLDSIGVRYEDLLEKGTVALEGSQFEYGKTPAFKTDSGKALFKNGAVSAIGANPIITWIDRKTHPAEGEFYFINGKQSIHAHTMSTNIEALMSVTKRYHLERLWINAADAAAMGVSEGDTVEIASPEHRDTVEAHVTERIRPGVVYTPMHYGGSSPYLTHSYGYGICMPDFVPFDTEPGTGSNMAQEVTVTIRKVGA